MYQVECIDLVLGTRRLVGNFVSLEKAQAYADAQALHSKAFAEFQPMKAGNTVGVKAKGVL